MQFDEISIKLCIYIITVTGIVGLIVGSFLNVIGLRLLSGESIVFPPSKCPKCVTKLAWYDNIPVLGYILLLGKCRYCKEPIDIQYPIVELVTGLLFIGIVGTYGLGLKTFFLLFLVCALIVITITDLKEKVIFDITATPLIPIGLIYNFFDIGKSGLGTVKIPLDGIGYTLTLNEIFISAIIGAIIGALFFEVCSRLGLLFVGEYAFGGGDTIIGAALGAWFGWKMILLILLISFVFQLIVGLPIILMNMYRQKDYKSIVFMGLLLFSVCIPYIGQLSGISSTFFGALTIAALAFGLAGAGITVVLKRAKERQSFTFIPFGPALVFGGLLVIFHGQSLLNFYLKGFSG